MSPSRTPPSMHLPSREHAERVFGPRAAPNTPLPPRRSQIALIRRALRHLSLAIAVLAAGIGLAGSGASLYLSLSVLAHNAGVWGVVIGVLVFPVTFFITPLYAAYVWDDWMPLELAVVALVGGGFLCSVAAVLMLFSDAPRPPRAGPRV